MNKTLAGGITAVIAATVAVVGVTQLTGSEASSWKGTLNASIQQAVSGDTIVVPPGTYPGETISPEAKTLTVAAAGATFGGLTFTGVQNLTVDGITVTGGLSIRPFPVLGTVNNTSQLPTNIVVENADLKVFTLRNAVNVTLRDSSVGGQNVSTSGLSVPKIGGYAPATGTPYKPSSGIVIERVSFHDIIRTVQGSTHAECLFIDGGTDGVVISDSSFTNCGVFDVFGGPSSAGGISGVTLERNLLDVPRDTVGGAAPSAINFKGGNTDLIIKNNSILGVVRVDAASYPGLLVQDNAINNGSGFGVCSLVPAASFVANTMTTTCGGVGNIQALPPFVSAVTVPCGLQPWDGSCYRNDLHVTSGLDGVPVPPPPAVTDTTPTVTTDTTPTVPACVAPTLGWKLPTRATITLTWPTVPDATGYRLYKAGKLVSTAGAAAVSAKFGSLPYAATLLGVAAICPDGERLSELTTTETRVAG